MQIDGGDMAITLDSLKKNQKAVNRDVPYNTEKLGYKVRLPESVQETIVSLRVDSKLPIYKIAEIVQCSHTTARKVLVQRGILSATPNKPGDKFLADLLQGD